MQTPRFLGFEYICGINTYNRGMAQYMIFNRVELAQPHEYSWPAAPYHANIPVRKSIRHKKKWSHKLLDIRTVSINIFRSCFFCPINHVASVLSKNFLSEKKSFRSLFFLIHVQNAGTLANLSSYVSSNVCRKEETRQFTLIKDRVF